MRGLIQLGAAVIKKKKLIDQILLDFFSFFL